MGGRGGGGRGGEVGITYVGAYTFLGPGSVTIVMFDVCLFFSLHSYRRDRSTFIACPHSTRVNFSGSTNSSMTDKESRLYNNSSFINNVLSDSNQ